MTHFSSTLQPTLRSISEAQWFNIFPDYPLSPQVIWLMGDNGFDDIPIYSLVIWDGENPVLYLPLFLTEFPVDPERLSKKKQRWARVLKALHRRWVCPLGLAIGFVEGGGGAIGISPHHTPTELEAAWAIALEELKRFCKQQRASLLVFFDFSEEESQKLPVQVRQYFDCWDSLPVAQMEVTARSRSEFIRSLPRKVRHDINRKIRQTPPFSIVYTQEPGPWLDQIYEMYRQKAENSDSEMGIQHYEFFQSICAVDPTAQYVLFMDASQSSLIGFSLILVSPRQLNFLYFGLDANLGKQYNLYFQAWLENIRYCIEHQIPSYYSGNTLEKLKKQLGATLQERSSYCGHQNPMTQWIYQSLETAVSEGRITATK